MIWKKINSSDKQSSSAYLDTNSTLKLMNVSVNTYDKDSEFLWRILLKLFWKSDYKWQGKRLILWIFRNLFEVLFVKKSWKEYVLCTMLKWMQAERCYNVKWRREHKYNREKSIRIRPDQCDSGHIAFWSPPVSFIDE